jgi:dihydroorotase
MSRTLIRNVRILDPAEQRDAICHVVLDGLQIDSVTPAEHAPPPADHAHEVDATGLWLVPGAVDLAARFREPGHTAKADFASETGAAFAGGVTRVVLPPDTDPVLDTPAMVVRVLRIAKASQSPWIMPLGALTRGLAGTALAEMSALCNAGCVGLSNGLTDLQDPLLARRALEYAKGLELTVHVQALDSRLANGGCAHEGELATRLGLAPIPVAAEVAALRFWISLVEDTGARVHFGRLSTARAVALVDTAQARGLPVSADVAAHQLFLTDAALEGFDALAHLMPPLRSDEDRLALRDAVRTGVIEAICSDHQPHELDAKTNPFPMTAPGASGIELLWPLTLRWMAEDDIDPLHAIARVTTAPALRLGLPAPRIVAGAAADLALIDPRQSWTLHRHTLHSRGHNTPLDGATFRHRVVGCWHHGQRRHGN